MDSEALEEAFFNTVLKQPKRRKIYAQRSLLIQETNEIKHSPCLIALASIAAFCVFYLLLHALCKLRCDSLVPY